MLNRVMLELFVIPVLRGAGPAIIGQRFPNRLEIDVQRVLERLRIEFRADHKYAILDVTWYLACELGLAFLDVVIKVDEHHNVSLRVTPQLWDIFIPKRIKHLAPTSCRWHNLYSSVVHLVMSDEAVGDLPIAVIFRNDIKVGRVPVHGHPIISSRIRALIRSPL